MPRAKKGDRVRCISYDYTVYPYGSVAEVLDVGTSDNTGSDLIKLANELSPLGYSWYLTKNFQFLERAIKQETKQMAAYEKTKYFVAVVDEERSTPIFLVHDPDSVGPLRDYKSEAIKDAELRIRADDAGKKLIILQIIALVQEEDPRPPIKITEYK
ncbi:hypothetical protein EVB68_029 [Rhizobium phage RHph_Y2_6]|uniref:Uncharacterized protein n=1 Tax=Rhizobium phage RHph_Y2_6 TaxID=2509576 RepID=A0A7S5UTZ1_9CAUD|nr:hypothetical protein PP748_gp029 [Rhizobium phage RHph_Y2_6]QIG68766.1 hypothetical protein EVB68_029 [Rhizobium phage RHph_Y2_6]